MNTNENIKRLNADEKLFYQDMLKVGVNAEWDNLKDVLVSTPGTEIFPGTLDYLTNDYQAPFSVSQAAKEHDNFKKIMSEEFGIRVHDVKNILLNDSENLRKLAEDSLTYKIIGNNHEVLEPTFEQKHELSYLKNQTLHSMSNEDLLKIVFEQPTIYISNSGNRLSNNYMVKPITNHFFQRDPQIVTDKGIVIGKMKNGVRQNEVLLSKIVFESMGIKPIHQINGSATLEGGDFVAAKDYALIGLGLRTNANAIDQLINSNAMGYGEIGVVVDSFRQQDEMHLDTYFNFVAHNKALLLEDRMNNNPQKSTSVIIYKRNSVGDYVQQNSVGEISFQNYLKSKDVHIIPISKEMQMNYGINILTINENNILAVKGIGEAYYSLLKKEGINVHQLELTNLTKGYGGPHCMTQVLSRK